MIVARRSSSPTINSKIRRRISALVRRAVSAQAGNASYAADTAPRASSTEALGTVVITSAVDGS
jgi:hypothetical protein